MRRIVVVLLYVVFLTACDQALQVSDNLTTVQRQAWSAALAFPSYCEDGVQVMNAPESPLLYFIQTKKLTLVYDVCERYAYQDSINLFRLDRNVKPHLIRFPVMELDESSVKYSDDELDSHEPKTGIFRVKISSMLTQRGIEAVGDGQINVIRHFAGTGTCGTLTTYDIRQDVAQVVAFRARLNCAGEQYDMQKWPLYSSQCSQETMTETCVFRRIDQ